jgi:hypothetical protein
MHTVMNVVATITGPDNHPGFPLPQDPDHSNFGLHLLPLNLVRAELAARHLNMTDVTLHFVFSPRDFLCALTMFIQRANGSRRRALESSSTGMAGGPRRRSDADCWTTA